ncbi:histone-lysine N-methyltransferase SETMAR-like [Octopus sinensis]|uniref:Histone-lysine N-methyltransferase SETMAR-like n=1 Tax=Octopus sinensis TaxID=2607531 RepID=A0A7E6EH33_9MOLL|nr:histone-lysine N-methyltransferase SETMAR-like [Octopus sinensis]
MKDESVIELKLVIIFDEWWKYCRWSNFTPAVEKEINDVEDPGIINEREAQNWLRRFRNDDTSLEDKPKSGKTSIVEHKALLEIVEQQPSTSARTLSAALGPSQTTIN